MKKKFIDSVNSSPFATYTSPINTPFGGNSSERNSPFFHAPEKFVKTGSKQNGLKKQSLSLQRIILESTPKLPQTAENSILLRSSKTGLEKIRRRPRKLDINSILNRMDSNQNSNVTKDFIHSSCNSSLLSGNFVGRSTVNEKSPQPAKSSDDSAIRLTFNKTFINNRLNGSNQYTVTDSKQKINEFQERIDSIQEKIHQFIGNNIWSKEISQQLQTYSAQTKVALDKAYSKFILFPDVEQDLMDALTSKELSFIKIIKLIKSSLGEMMTSNEHLNQSCKILGEENKKLKSQFQAEKTMNYQMKDGTTPIDIKSLLQNTLASSEKNERVWEVEKQQMAAQIEKLSDEIEEMKRTNNFNELKKQYDSYQNLVYVKVKELEKELEEREVKVLKLENQLVRSTTSYRDLQREFKELSNKYTELKAEYDDKKKEFNRSTDENIKFREIAYMSKEDLLHLQIKYNNLSETLRKTTKKCMDAQYKLDKLKREQSEMSVVNEAEFQKDSSLLNIIKETFITFRRPQVALKTQNAQGNLLSTDLISAETVQLDRYLFNKPAFYVFIQQEFDAEMTNSDFLLEEKSFTIDRESLSIIRAILDSKYNEFAYYDDTRLHSQFPDFVYSWLMSFYVCPIEKRIKNTIGDDASEIQKRRNNFYRFLLNPKMNKIWDVATFRDFLEEKCAPDEVFFYLSCRYILFQGPQLNYIGSCINPVQWVQFDKVEKLIEIVLTKLGQEDFNTIKYKLKERAKKKTGRFFIDSGFVLRVLLEFYKNEKKLKLVMLQDTLNKVSVFNKSNKPHVTFDIFKQFIETNYPFTSELEKARLYREAWYIGNGRVDYESFFIAANESNFFIEGLRNLIFQKTVTLGTYNLTPEDEEMLQEVNELVTNKYQNMIRVFEKSLSFARSLGIESVVSSITQMENSLTKKFNLAYDENKGHGLYILFNQLIQTFLRIRNQYFLTYRNSPAGENNLAKSDSEGIDIIMEAITQYAIFDQADNMEKNNKIRKFQIYYRHKKSNWFSLVNTMLQKVRSRNSGI